MQGFANGERVRYTLFMLTTARSALSATQFDLLSETVKALEAAVQRGEFTAWSIACPLQTSSERSPGSAEGDDEILVVSCSYADEWLRSSQAPDDVASLPHPIFDLASLSKPLLAGLTLPLMRPNDWSDFILEPEIPSRLLRTVLEERPRADDHDLGVLERAEWKSLRLLDLLSHQSGLPAWRWFGRGLFNPDQKSLGTLQDVGSGAFLNFDRDRLVSFRRNLIRSILEAPLTSGPPQATTSATAAATATATVRYSDCGYYLLAKILEAQGSSGGYWRQALQEINSTLGTQFEHASLKPSVALNAVPFFRYIRTEDDGSRGESSYPAYGPCNDTNANILASLGPANPEVSSHAGLFGSAGDVWKGFSSLRRSLSTLPDAMRLSTLRNTRFCYCLDTPTSSTSPSAAPSALAPDVYGHLGFTGTSAWFHLATGAGWVLLTNRTASRRVQRSDGVPRLLKMNLGPESSFALQEPGGPWEDVSPSDWGECRERHLESGLLLWDSASCDPFRDLSPLRRQVGTLLWSLPKAERP